MTEIISETLGDDGVFPNNPALPLVLYRNAMVLPEHDPATAFEALFTRHQWPAAWRNGVFSFHHYHSTAHEVLGIYCGEAEVQLGGDNGIVVTIGCGDVVVIPAGVAHKKTALKPGFRGSRRVSDPAKTGYLLRQTGRAARSR